MKGRPTMLFLWWFSFNTRFGEQSPTGSVSLDSRRMSKRLFWQRVGVQTDE